MKTAGDILKKARLAKGYTLDQVAQATKIRPIFLSYIEANDYSHFDSPAAVYGFITSYARFLELDESQVKAVFKRDYSIDAQGKIVPRRLLTKSLPVKAGVNWLIYWPLGLVLLLAMVLFWHYRWYLLPPPLTIDSPDDVAVVTSERLVVKGRTLPEAEVTVNNLKTTSGPDGYFEQPILLIPGVNQVVVQVKYRRQQRQRQLDVIYRP